MPEAPVSTLSRAAPAPAPTPATGHPSRAVDARGATRPVWLFIDLACAFGGHEVMLLRWMSELQRQGDVEPVLVCNAGSRLAELGAAQGRTIELPAPAGHRIGRIAGFANLLQRLWRLKRQLRPQLAVVAEGCLLAQRHGLYAARAVGLPTLLYVPLVSSFAEMGVDDAPRLDRIVRERYRKLPTAWLTITPAQADELRRWTGISQPVYCLPNTVAVPALPPVAPRSGPARVLVLGRLDAHQKGLDVLLDHLRAHPELGRHVRVSVVGEGPYGATLSAALQGTPHLADSLALEGWQDPAEALARHDVLLLASRFEGVPLVMLEAMAAGVPVVSTDLPGTRPYLPDTCLFPFGRLDAAFDIVRTLHRDAHHRADVIARNRASFDTLASGPAFEAGVQRLTRDLSTLGARA